MLVEQYAVPPTLVEQHASPRRARVVEATDSQPTTPYDAPTPEVG